MAENQEIIKPHISPLKKRFLALITALGLSFPGCANEMNNNAILEEVASQYENGDRIVLVSGELTPSQNINIRSEPVVRDNLETGESNVIATLEAGKQYILKDYSQ